MYGEWNRPCKRLARAGRKKLTEVEILFSVKVKDFMKNKTINSLSFLSAMFGAV